MTPDVTAFGELLVDLIGQEQSTLDEVDTLAKRPGGAPANFAVACSRLDADARLVSKVGDDSFGDFLIDEIQRHGVDTGQISRSDRRTTLAFACLDEQNSPDFMFYRDQHADIELAPEDIDIDAIQDSDLFHFGSLSLTHEPVRSALLHVLDRVDTTVSCDPNLRDELWGEDLAAAMERVLPHVDHLVLAEDELRILFEGNSDEDRAAQARQQYGIDEVVVTRGGDGASYYSDQTLHQDAFDADVVDTTGAGDAFAAGYLVHRLQGREPEHCLRTGCEVAARCVEAKGGMASLPDSDELARGVQHD